MSQTPSLERPAFFASLEKSIKGDSQTRTGLLLIDIANLREINHEFGVASGDMALTTSLQRLLAISKLPDTIFRISGHHFAYIFPSLGNPGLIMLAISKIKRQLSEDVEINGANVHLNIHMDIQIGFSISSPKNQRADQLLLASERSLQLSKSGILYDQHDWGDDESLVEKHSLENHFKDTLAANGFELYYQPKVNLQTGVIDRAEALLRWRSAEGQLLSPEVAVSLAEKCGESYTLTKWIVHSAVRRLEKWQSSMGVGIAVNLQAGLLASPDLVPLITDALAIWGADKNKLTLEITESAVFEDKDAGLNNLLELRGQGITLSIDDFGTGYSSLSYFKDIPAAELKIDRSFVTDMMNNQKDLDLVKIIIDIAHVFDLQVVAEGVEDEATLQQLKLLGCDYVQGYFISRPMPADEFEKWYKGYPSTTGH